MCRAVLLALHRVRYQILTFFQMPVLLIDKHILFHVSHLRISNLEISWHCEVWVYEHCGASQRALPTLMIPKSDGSVWWVLTGKNWIKWISVIKINYNKLMTFNTMVMILVFLKLVSLCVQMLFVRGLQSGEECYQFKDDHWCCCQWQLFPVWQICTNDTKVLTSSSGEV